MTPTNLPLPPLKFPVKTPSMQDLIGLYDGGGNLDCGIFRPTGRCKMRSGFNKTTPFCHVCRYLIVDKLNPVLHRKLDERLYADFYPA